jgi:transposase-like protein
VLLRDKRDRASAEAFSRQALPRTEVKPKAVITDHHQPYGKAVATVIPLARHVRTGLHRCRGYTTQPIERSHVPTRDRLRGREGSEPSTPVSGFCTGPERGLQSSV